MNDWKGLNQREFQSWCNIQNLHKALSTHNGGENRPTVILRFALHTKSNSSDAPSGSQSSTEKHPTCKKVGCCFKRRPVFQRIWLHFFLTRVSSWMWSLPVFWTIRWLGVLIWSQGVCSVPQPKSMQFTWICSKGDLRSRYAMYDQ